MATRQRSFSQEYTYWQPRRLWHLYQSSAKRLNWTEQPYIKRNISGNTRCTVPRLKNSEKSEFKTTAPCSVHLCGSKLELYSATRSEHLHRADTRMVWMVSTVIKATADTLVDFNEKLRQTIGFVTHEGSQYAMKMQLKVEWADLKEK